MILVLVIDLIVIAGLVHMAVRKGLEEALPAFAFWLVLIPGECVIHLPGLFDLTTQRIEVVTLTVLYFTLRNRKAGAVEKRPTALKYLILIHVGWCFVSTANSVVPVTSIKMMLSQLLEYYLIYLAFVKSISQYRTVQRISFAMVGAVTVACIFGYFEAYHDWHVTSLFPPVSHRFGSADFGFERGWRVESTFPHAILFGGAIVTVIPITFHLLSLAKTRGRKLFLWAGLMLMFMNVYKTTSRGPWLALMLSFILFFPLCQRKVRKYMLVICAFSVSVLVIRPGVWQSIKNVYFASLDPEMPMGASYEYRHALLGVAKQALARDSGRAMWGYGMESFYYLGLEGEFLGKPDHKFLSCDSAWIALMVETGYVGLILIAVLLFKPALMALKDSWRMPKPDAYLSRVFFIDMVAYYFMMTNVAMYSWGQNGYMLWIIIAMSIAYRTLERTEDQLCKYNLQHPAALRGELVEVARA